MFFPFQRFSVMRLCVMHMVGRCQNRLVTLSTPSMSSTAPPSMLCTLNYWTVTSMKVRCREQRRDKNLTSQVAFPNVVRMHSGFRCVLILLAVSYLFMET